MASSDVVQYRSPLRTLGTVLTTAFLAIYVVWTVLPIFIMFVSSLNNTSGNPIVIDGLWALKFGNAGPGFSADKLYFTAGLNGEADGLFGSLQSVPEPSTGLLLTGALLLGAAIRRRMAA